MKKLILFLVILVNSLQVYAEFFEIEGIKYLTLSDSTVSVSSKEEKYSGNIDVPPFVTYNGKSYTVTSLGYAFMYCEELTSISIPNTIKVLEGKMGGVNGSAFKGCKGLISVSLPDSLQTIEDDVFSGCEKLETISIPEMVKSIGKKCFFSCINLEKISLPRKLKKIEERTFWGCTRLSEILFPDSLQSIGQYAFQYCENLRDVYLNDELKGIGMGAFYGCKSLSNVRLSNSLSYIAGELFRQCSSLDSISIPGKVTNIGYAAFSGCPLKEVSLPRNLKEIDDEAFDLIYINNIYCYAQMPPSIKNNTFNPKFFSTEQTYDKTKVYVLEGSLEAYKSDYYWNKFPNYISVPEYTLTYIIDGDVYKEEKMAEGTEITPEPAPTKEGYTFSGWSDIPETMPANDVVVTGSFSAIEIKEDTGEFTATSGSTVELSNDNNVGGVYEIPETVTHDGVTYTVTSIGNEAFKDNNSLTDVTIPSTITSIGESAFAGCSNLKSITVYSTTPIAFPSASRTRSESSVFEGVDKNTCLLYVPEGCVEVYKSAPVWREFTNILVIGTSSINGILFDSGKTQDIYRLDGRMVKSNATSLDGLPKGVYIINGKKVLK